MLYDTLICKILCIHNLKKKLFAVKLKCINIHEIDYIFNLICFDISVMLVYLCEYINEWAASNFK